MLCMVIHTLQHSAWECDYYYWKSLEFCLSNFKNKVAFICSQRALSDGKFTLEIIFQPISYFPKSIDCDFFQNLAQKPSLS